MVTKWILILTLYNFRQNNGPAMTSNIESVYGFKSESSCMNAANAWIRNNNRFTHIRALCVPE